MFESTDDSDIEPSRLATLDDHLSDDEIERYLRFGLEESLGRHPPTPPPRVVSAEKEEEKFPTYNVLPFVQKTTVTLKFARKTLEEFMDR